MILDVGGPRKFQRLQCGRRSLCRFDQDPFLAGTTSLPRTTLQKKLVYFPLNPRPSPVPPTHQSSIPLNTNQSTTLSIFLSSQIFREVFVLNRRFLRTSHRILFPSYLCTIPTPSPFHFLAFFSFLTENQQEKLVFVSFYFPVLKSTFDLRGPLTFQLLARPLITLNDLEKWQLRDFETFRPLGTLNGHLSSKKVRKRCEKGYVRK